MQKKIVLAMAILITVGTVSAVDRHGPMKTGLFEVESDGELSETAGTVTIPGKSVEQDSYREGNDAEYEKKTWGQPAFDDLEMERGVKPGALELHDGKNDVKKSSARKGRNPQTGKEIKIPAKKKEKKKEHKKNGIANLASHHGEDIRAGAADSARKEISVKEIATGHGDDVSDATTDKEDFRSENEGFSGKGRNPQTGKEIRIPSKANDVKELADQLVTLRSYDYDGENTPIIKLRDKESGEDYFVHATDLIDEIRDEDDANFELREGRKGMNAVDVRRTD